jgi:hypothetical protein
MAKFSGNRRPKPKPSPQSRLDGLAVFLQKVSTFSAPMDTVLSQAFRDESRMGPSARFFFG